MKWNFSATIGTIIVTLFLNGCATTDGTTAKTQGKRQVYRSTDGRNVDIGRPTSEMGGRSFSDPHMEKCWIADGFNFTGYDALVILPTRSTAYCKPEEEKNYKLALENVSREIANSVQKHGLFTVYRNGQAVPSGAKVLKMSNTVTDFQKGSSSGRFWAGTFGTGQPFIRVQGEIVDGGKTVFSYQASRSGVSAGARMGVMKDEDIQLQDIQSITLDLSDFMAAIAGKYQAKK